MEHRKKTDPRSAEKPARPSPIITDPQGCYTGRPIEKLETPVQDADDL